MTKYIPVGDQITPEWLDAVLRQTGALQQGEVTAVESEMTCSFREIR